VEARKTYPEPARRRGTEGTARLMLRVAPDGSLSKASIASSSGSPLLDASALGLAASVFPVDNPTLRELEITISVRYALKKQGSP
jgi:TonB family protein